MKPKPTPAHVGKMLPIGTKVAVLRPNLWAGAVGEVVKHEGSNHVCRVTAKDGGNYRFHCDVALEELKEIKP